MSKDSEVRPEHQNQDKPANKAGLVHTFRRSLISPQSSYFNSPQYTKKKNLCVLCIMDGKI